MGVLSALKPSPALSPERAALAAAVAAARESRETFAALETAHGRARQERWAADAAAEAAQAAVDQSARAAVQHMVDTALGSAGTPPMTPREARAALAEAQEHAELCVSTFRTLDGRLAEASSEVRQHADRLPAKVAAVIGASPELADLIAKVEHHQREMIRLGLALEGLMVPDEREPNGAMSPLGRVKNRMLLPPLSWDLACAPDRIPTVRPDWEAAARALESDARAPLPKV